MLGLAKSPVSAALTSSKRNSLRCSLLGVCGGVMVALLVSPKLVLDRLAYPS